MIGIGLLPQNCSALPAIYPSNTGPTQRFRFGAFGLAEKLLEGKLWAVGRNLRFTGAFGLQEFLARVHSFARIFSWLGARL
jgi:hypothetical protein